MNSQNNFSDNAVISNYSFIIILFKAYLVTY